MRIFHLKLIQIKEWLVSKGHAFLLKKVNQLESYSFQSDHIERFIDMIKYEIVTYDI
jgi:hypothetical protein